MTGLRSWTDEQLTEAVAKHNSMAAVIRELGLRVAGGSYTSLHFHILRLGLSTAHHTGKGWARDRRGVTSHPTPLDEILVENSRYQNAGKLRKRLIREGLKAPRCERCGRDSWLELPLPLELDHINGERTDNRLENLRILCPNCHAQTDTWCVSKRELARRRSPIR
ncbi:MAG: HNH endonuclease [Actinobacteria bacterium]|nr:HNH endonuclease [Actinomycetota bacterium]MBV9933279.1 HNH endonuclease [Actinomycetota bacterium]